VRTRPARREPLALLGLIVVGLVISGLEPADRLTWLLEVAPVLAGLLVLIGTYRRFPLTPLSYRLVFLLSLLASGRRPLYVLPRAGRSLGG
jgi:putative membrane protein